MDFEKLFGGKYATFYYYITDLDNRLTFSKILRINSKLIKIRQPKKSSYLHIYLLSSVMSMLKYWYKHNQTTYEGSNIYVMTSQFGLQMLI